MTGRKLYCRYTTDLGTVHPSQMLLSDYHKQMGAGQVNATKLLNAINGKGTQVKFPNLYVPLDGNVTVTPGNYFIDGEQLTYTVTIDDTTVATATAEGNKLVVKGTKAGATTAKIATSNDETQTFRITVRKGANGNGWL